MLLRIARLFRDFGSSLFRIVHMPDWDCQHRVAPTLAQEANR